MAPPMANCSCRSQRGYTYFGVLFAVFLIGLALAGAALLWDVQQRREKERELLFVGKQYIDAIASYYHAAPGGAKKYPRSMEELLRDPRHPNIKRHLRRPWRDPMTGSTEWEIILTKDGGIAGIHSRAAGEPLKQAGFGELEQLLAGKTRYRDWRFLYVAAADDNGDRGSATENTWDEGDAGNAGSVVERLDDEAEDETGEELLEAGKETEQE